MEITYLTVHLSDGREVYISQDDDGDWSVMDDENPVFKHLCDDLQTLLYRIEGKANDALN